MYPDKDSFGVEIKENDKIILTDILFTETIGYNEDGSKKKREDVKYSNVKLIIKQLGKDAEKVVDNMYKEDWLEWEETKRREFLENYSSPANGFNKLKGKN